MADKRPAGQLVSGLREVLDPALGQIGVRQLFVAVRDPMDDDLLEPLAEQRAGDRVSRGRDRPERIGRRRRHDVDVQRVFAAKLPVVGREFQHVIAGRGEGGRRFGGVGVLEGDISRPGLFAPGRRQLAIRLAVAADAAAEPRLARQDDGPVEARDDHGREVRRIAPVVDPPLEDAGRFAAGIHLQAELRRVHVVEGRRVEGVFLAGPSPWRS